MEIDKNKNQMLLKPLSEPGDELWGGMPARWWKGKFKEYGKNYAHTQSGVRHYKSNPVKLDEYTRLFRHYEILLKNLIERADRAGLPKKFRTVELRSN